MASASANGAPRPAVFYDVDGTLVDSNIVYAYIYFALRTPKISERMGRILRAALFSPVYAAAELTNRQTFNRLFYANYKGMAVERLRLMGREVVERALLPNMYAEGKKRIEKARELGLVQVIVSGSLDIVMDPFAEQTGVDHVIANRLEYEGGVATGQLLSPVLAGDAKRYAMEEFALQHNIDLSRSYAFADSRYDLPMLECVGFPVAVNPEPKLARIAADRQWPSAAFA